MRFTILPLCALLIGLSSCGRTSAVGTLQDAPEPTTVARATMSVQAAVQKETVMPNTPSSIPEEEQPTPVPLSTTTAPPSATPEPAPSTPVFVQSPPPVTTTPSVQQMRRATQMPVQATQPVPDATANTQNAPSLEPQTAALVQGARADLAQRQAVAIDAVEVVEVRSVTWPDPGLGCPQPGVGYKQVPVDGLLIRLRVGGTVFNYHSGGRKAPFLCEQPQKPIPAHGSGGEGQ